MVGGAMWWEWWGECGDGVQWSSDGGGDVVTVVVP